jgi:hypothetical protein
MVPLPPIAGELPPPMPPIGGTAAIEPGAVAVPEAGPAIELGLARARASAKVSARVAAPDQAQDPGQGMGIGGALVRALDRVRVQGSGQVNRQMVSRRQVAGQQWLADQQVAGHHWVVARCRAVGLRVAILQ